MGTAFSPPILIALAIFLALPARADILFIDLNASASEIAAAQKAATARGEKLVVLPQRTPEQQEILAEIHNLDLRRQPLDYELPNLLAQAAKDPSAQIQARIAAVKAKMAANIAQSTDLRNQVKALGIPHFSISELDSVLQSYSRSGRAFETVILSGHHGVVSFFGLLGGVQDESSIAKSFAKYPALLNAVHSYYGWGCYSNTPDEALNWQEAFPQLKITGGFDGSAPGAESEPDPGFLSALLAKESVLEHASEEKASQQSMDQVAEMIRSINDYSKTNASVCTCGECVGKNIGEISLQGTDGCDDEAFASLESAYHRAMDAMKADVPCDTQHSPLRDFYDLARLKTYCGRMAGNFSGYTGFAGKTLREIFLPQVLKNFALYYADEIRQVKQLASRCSPATPIPDLSQPLSCVPPTNEPPHALHLSDISKMRDTLASLHQNQACVSNPADGALLGRFSCDLSGLYSVPAGWVDPPENGSQLAKPMGNCTAGGVRVAQ